MRFDARKQVEKGDFFWLDFTRNLRRGLTCRYSKCSAVFDQKSITQVCCTREHTKLRNREMAERRAA